MINSIFKAVIMYALVYSPHLVCFLRSIHLERVSNSGLLVFHRLSLFGKVAAASLHDTSFQSKGRKRNIKQERKMIAEVVKGHLKNQLHAPACK